MKKFLALALCIVVMTMMAISINAFDDNVETEIIFEDDSIFTETEKAAIYNHFNNTPKNESRGLSCTLFGHDYKTEYVYFIKHKVRSGAPRCDEEMYEVNVCTKCEDVQSTLINVTYVFCCE